MIQKLLARDGLTEVSCNGACVTLTENFAVMEAGPPA